MDCPPKNSSSEFDPGDAPSALRVKRVDWLGATAVSGSDWRCYLDAAAWAFRSGRSTSLDAGHAVFDRFAEVRSHLVALGFDPDQALLAADAVLDLGLGGDSVTWFARKLNLVLAGIDVTLAPARAWSATAHGQPVWVRSCSTCGEVDLHSFWADPLSVGLATWRCGACSGADHELVQLWLPDAPEGHR